MESPRFKGDIDKLVLRDGYRPGAGAMPGTSQETGSVQCGKESSESLIIVFK